MGFSKGAERVLRAFLVFANMATRNTLLHDFARLNSPFREIIDGTWNWKNCAAVFGLCAGFAAPILGSIVTAISWFKDPSWHGLSLHQAGTTLFVLTLPLLILGAHCLDLLDKEKNVYASVSRRRCD
jgi:hypothetical protein